MTWLTETQKELLVRNGFVVLPSTRYPGMTDAYDALKKQGQPVFVTTDALLHAAHLFFDYTLRAIEITALRVKLERLTETLLIAAARDLKRAADPQVRKAALRNLAFFSTGARLLDPARQTPAEVEEMVQAELKLIAEQTTGTPPPCSAVLGIREDYTQYIPRGHYTRNDAFRTYFLASMWFGRMGFLLYPSESHGLDPVDVQRLARQALLDHPQPVPRANRWSVGPRHLARHL